MLKDKYVEIKKCIHKKLFPILIFNFNYFLRCTYLKQYYFLFKFLFVQFYVLLFSSLDFFSFLQYMDFFRTSII